MRVAVVGAGLAGLAAARRAAGCRASTSPSSRRATGSAAASGRASSRTAPSSRWAPSSSCRATTRSWLRRAVRARPLGEGDALRRREPRGGIGVTAQRAPATRSRPSAALPATRRARSFRSRPPRFAPLDAGAREAIRARLEVSAAATADRVDASALAGLAAHSACVCPERRGREPAHLAAASRRRARQAVHLSSPVERVVWGEAAALVRAGGVRARRRPRRARAPRERGRPDRLRSAAARAPSAPPTPQSSTATRRSCSFRSPADRRRAPCSPCPSATGAGPRRGANGVQPVVHAFAGSAPALARLRVEDRPCDLARLTRAVARRPGARPGSRGALDLGRRSVDPCRVLLRGAAVRRVVPGRPFHACGEHTDVARHALMDGALASGVRAAQEILGARYAPGTIPDRTVKRRGGRP